MHCCPVNNRLNHFCWSHSVKSCCLLQDQRVFFVSLTLPLIWQNQEFIVYTLEGWGFRKPTKTDLYRCFLIVLLCLHCASPVLYGCVAFTNMKCLLQQYYLSSSIPTTLVFTSLCEYLLFSADDNMQVVCIQKMFYNLYWTKKYYCKQ